MVKPLEDMQKMNQAGMETSMKMMGEFGKSWQAITAEMTDYTKRSFEDGTQTLEKLMTAKSMEQALEIQTTYAKRAFDDYMHQVSKLGGMYSDLSKDAYKPVERAMQGGR